MARFCTLYSGSSGNSTYIGCGSGGILVDAGVSCKALLTALSAREISVESLRGLFITHEHVDHIKGLRVLLKKYPIPLFAPRETLDDLAERDELPAGLPVNEVDASTRICVDDMEITPFATSHDSRSSYGYRVELPDGRIISVATDLGHVSEEVHRGISGSDLVLLEANYDEGMLRCGPYPYPLKRRISSDSGHLSNTMCADEALQLIREGTTRLVLGHLSKENNLPLLARETVSSELTVAGMREGGDYLLRVAERSCPGEMIVF